jgi:hypothetical protein
MSCSAVGEREMDMNGASFLHNAGNSHSCYALVPVVMPKNNDKCERKYYKTIAKSDALW